MRGNSKRLLIGLCLGYAVLLISVVNKLSLWLDEVLQLVCTRDLAAPEMVRYIATQAGAAPLGYFVQAGFINALGFSLFSARIPSVIASVLACALLWLLARQFRLSSPLFAVVVFMVMPLQFRYALEARPYSQALLCSVLATVLLWVMLRGVTAAKGISYGVVVLLGTYLQPLTVFVPVSHLAWVTGWYAGANRLHVRKVLVLAIGAAILLFIPWFLFVRATWHAVIAPITAAGQGFHWSAKTPLMILRELSGAGYWGGGLLLLACGAGLRSPMLDRQHKALLCLTIALPIAGALLADVLFGYFLAIRQMIFALPGIVLLAVSGFDFLYRERRTVALCWAAGFLAFSFWYDVAWFHKPREDWQAAASQLVLEAETACILPMPAKSIEWYRFFEPELSQRVCQLGSGQETAVILAGSPYASDQERQIAAARLVSHGLQEGNRIEAGGTQILRFERPGSAHP